MRSETGEERSGAGETIVEGRRPRVIHISVALLRESYLLTAGRGPLGRSNCLCHPPFPRIPPRPTPPLPLSLCLSPSPCALSFFLSLPVSVPLVLSVSLSLSDPFSVFISLLGQFLSLRLSLAGGQVGFFDAWKFYHLLSWAGGRRSTVGALNKVPLPFGKGLGRSFGLHAFRSFLVANLLAFLGKSTASFLIKVP